MGANFLKVAFNWLNVKHLLSVCVWSLQSLYWKREIFQLLETSNDQDSYFDLIFKRISGEAKLYILCMLNILMQNTCKWDIVFKNGPIKILGRQPFKNLNGYGLFKQPYITSIFLKGAFHHKFYLAQMTVFITCIYLISIYYLFSFCTRFTTIW